MQTHILNSSKFKDFIHNHAKIDGLIYSGYHVATGFDFSQEVGYGKNPFEKFFKFLRKALERGEKYWFSEKQTWHNITHSGIMIDIDAYQADNVRKLDKTIVKSIVQEIALGVYEWIEISPGTKTVFAVVHNKAPYLIDGRIKEGLHVLAPGIMISREAKNAVYKSVAPKLQGIFEENGFLPGPVLDEHSSTVPAQIYGTIRKEKTEAHTLSEGWIYTVEFKENGVVRVEHAPGALDAQRDNIPLELSLHYQGPIITKTQYQIRASKEQLSLTYNVISQLDSDEEQIEKKCAALKLQSLIAYETFHLMKLVSVERGRGGNYKDWAAVCKNILRVDIRFMPFAAYFSIKSDSDSWAKGGAEKLLGFRSEIESELKYSFPTVISTRAMKWLWCVAFKDNRIGACELEKKTIINKIKRVVGFSSTVITDMIIADIIREFIGEKLHYINLSSQNSRTGFWFEYIDEDQSSQSEYSPFVYKYYKHTSNTPKFLTNFITVTLHDCIQNVFRDVRSVISAARKEEKESGKKKAEMEETVTARRLENAINRCGNISGIKAIVGACEIKLANNSFMYQIDKDDNVIGVGNGLLIFTGKKAIFKQERTEHKISRTTDTLYFPYDPLNKAVAEVNRVLADIIPDPAKLEALLMHFSQCFVGSSAGRYFNIFYSGGASGKSILMSLIQNALGLISSCKFGAGSGFGYSESIDANIFTSDKKDVGGADPQLINIEHARFVHCAEGKSGLIRPDIFKKLRDGTSIRGLYEKARAVVFKGIIAITTNDQPRFLNYNYALVRRFLYMLFPTRFVDSPKMPNEKKMNPDFANKSAYDKVWGAAFLSILVHHWNLLQEKYGGHVDTPLETSGILEETNIYLNSQNYMLQFRCSNVKVTNNSEDVINLTDFCRTYAAWYKKKLGIFQEITPESFTAEALDNFASHIKVEKNGHFMVGIKLIDV